MQFLNEVRSELSKVVWPKMDEWVGSTIVVLFLILVFAIYLGVVDYAHNWLIQHILQQYSV